MISGPTSSYLLLLSSQSVISLWLIQRVVQVLADGHPSSCVLYSSSVSLVSLLSFIIGGNNFGYICNGVNLCNIEHRKQDSPQVEMLSSVTNLEI